MHLARPQVEIDAVERQHARKLLADGVEPKQREPAWGRAPDRLRKSGGHLRLALHAFLRRRHSTEKVGLKSSGAREESLSKLFTFELSMT
ncbi:hypothetical protein FRZ61_06710 [Hypericibacter adhaerens]|uniref:Uncharacterized protein n=1 Tax=Hypericibacter adhaerens TaxID=2602016 RepID=A0A5J6MT01_9PROT|nr:hypothetical protein FRZ61_06710 [Hypericibacter adhaerens]